LSAKQKPLNKKLIFIPLLLILMKKRRRRMHTPLNKISLVILEIFYPH